MMGILHTPEEMQNIYNEARAAYEAQKYKTALSFLRQIPHALPTSLVELEELVISLRSQTERDQQYRRNELIKLAEAAYANPAISLSETIRAYEMVADDELWSDELIEAHKKVLTVLQSLIDRTYWPSDKLNKLKNNVRLGLDSESSADSGWLRERRREVEQARHSARADSELISWNDEINYRINELLVLGYTYNSRLTNRDVHLLRAVRDFREFSSRGIEQVVMSDQQNNLTTYIVRDQLLQVETEYAAYVLQEAQKQLIKATNFDAETWSTLRVKTLHGEVLLGDLRTDLALGLIRIRPTRYRQQFDDVYVGWDTLLDPNQNYLTDEEQRQLAQTEKALNEALKIVDKLTTIVRRIREQDNTLTLSDCYEAYRQYASDALRNEIELRENNALVDLQDDRTDLAKRAPDTMPPDALTKYEQTLNDFRQKLDRSELRDTAVVSTTKNQLAAMRSFVEERVTTIRARRRQLTYLNDIREQLNEQFHEQSPNVYAIEQIINGLTETEQRELDDVVCKWNRLREVTQDKYQFGGDEFVATLTETKQKATNLANASANANDEQTEGLDIELSDSIKDQASQMENHYKFETQERKHGEIDEYRKQQLEQLWEIHKRLKDDFERLKLDLQAAEQIFSNLAENEQDIYKN